MTSWRFLVVKVVIFDRLVEVQDENRIYKWISNN